MYRRTTGTDSRKLAEKIFAKVQTQIVEGRWFDLDKGKDIRMVEVIERFMTEVSPLQQGSQERNGQIADHLKTFFGDDLLEDVTPPLLSKYKAARLQTISKRGRTVSPDTVRKELSLLRRIFNVAIDEWELCKGNPVKKIIRSLPQENKRVRYVLPEEAEKLKFTIPAWLKPIIIVACQTGLRRGNFTRLTMAQLDFTSDRIVVGKTKNGDPLGIAMTSIVRTTLLDVIRLRKVVSPYVFCDAKGKPHSPYKISVAFKRACRCAGVENLRLHDLRHDFATLMLRKTKNLVDVQHAMGHKDSRMTLRYAHLLPDDLKSAYEAIDNEGTASIFSRFFHVEEEIKGATSVTP
jgi:integrase